MTTLGVDLPGARPIPTSEGQRIRRCCRIVKEQYFLVTGFVGLLYARASIHIRT